MAWRVGAGAGAITTGAGAAGAGAGATARTSTSLLTGLLTGSLTGSIAGAGGTASRRSMDGENGDDVIIGGAPIEAPAGAAGRRIERPR